MNTINKLSVAKRDLSVDCARGTAILLVVIGHIIQGSVTDYDHNFLYRIIYSFHMPLFFFLSGYVSFLSKSFKLDIIKKRFFNLIVPFFIWAILAFYFSPHANVGLVTYLLKVIYDPDIGLWFLWVLFFCFLATCFLSYLNVKIELGFLIMAVTLMAVAFCLPKDTFGSKLLGKEFPFFAAGYVCHKHRTSFLLICKKYLTYSSMLFAIGVCFWMRTQPPLFYNYNKYATVLMFFYNMIIAVLGTFSFFAAFQLIKDGFFSRMMAFTGQRSLSIYAIHFFLLIYVQFFYFTNGLYYVMVFVYSLCVIIICLLLDHLISLNTTLSLLLLGKTKK